MMAVMRASCSAFNETSWPIEIDALESADQRGSGRKIPGFSPGRSTPVGLPTPKALAPS